MASGRKLGIVYLYVVTRIETGQAYVGITVNARKRWNTHRWLANTGGSNQLIHRAIAKHGLDAFRFDVVACSRDWATGVIAERQLIEQTNSYVVRGGYNLTLGGEGPSGRPCSDETRALISTANSGRVGRKITDEEKQASRARLAERWATDPGAFTDWAKQGGQAQRGRVNGPGTRARMRAAALKVWADRRNPLRVTQHH